LIFFSNIFRPHFDSFFSFLFSVPPERISIRDESNSERNSVVGPYSEGDTMKLKCDVFGGRPTPNVTWYRDGYPLLSETVVVPSGRHLRSEIVVERLSRQDLNSRFTCKAINHHRATPVEVSVQLDMNCKWTKNVILTFLLSLFSSTLSKRKSPIWQSPIGEKSALILIPFFIILNSCSIKYSLIRSASTSTSLGRT
jgi:hypothetical protein